jgi:hypothetical protein
MTFITILSTQHYFKQVEFAVWDDMFRHMFAIFKSGFLLTITVSCTYCKPSM